MGKDLTNVTGYIYKITSPNNKFYIGQTINLKSRKNSYKKNNFKGQIKLWNNCQAHNWNPLDTFEIIESCFCGNKRITINEREVYWIKFYNSFNFGLNCNEGGGGYNHFGSGMSGKKHSEETKLKISKSEKGKIISLETKEKLRKINLGKKHSETTKKICSESAKNRNVINPRRKCSYKMYYITKNGINKKIKKELIDIYINDGWSFGRVLSEKHIKNLKGHKLSAETKRKMSIAKQVHKNTSFTI